MAGPNVPSRGVSSMLVEVLKDVEQRLGEQDTSLKAAQSELQAERAARKKLEAASGGIVGLGSASDELEEEIQKRRKLEEDLKNAEEALKQGHAGNGSEPLQKEIDELKIAREEDKKKLEDALSGADATEALQKEVDDLKTAREEDKKKLENSLSGSGASEALQKELDDIKEAWQKGGDKAEEDLSLKQDELDKVKSQLAQALSKASEAGDAEALQKEIDDLKKAGAEAQSKLTEALSGSSDKEALQKEVDELSKAREEDKKKLAEALNSSSGAEALQNEIEALKKEIGEVQAQAEAEIESKSAELEKTRDGLISVQQELQAATATAQDSGKVDALKQAVADLKKTNEKLSAELSKAKAIPPAAVKRETKAPPPPAAKVAEKPASKPGVPPPEAVSWIQALKKNPKDGNSLRKLADIYIKHELYEEALVPLKAAFKLSGRSAELSFLLGNAYYKAQHFQESLVPLSHAIRLNPKYAQAHYVLCMVNELVGNEEAAQKHYQIALKLNPKIEDSM